MRVPLDNEARRKRRSTWLTIGLVLVNLVACSSSSSGGENGANSLEAPDAFTKECTIPTANECPGNVCLAFGENAQKRSGVCTARCTADTT